MLFFLSACPKPACCIVDIHSNKVQEPHCSRAKRRGLVGMVVVGQQLGLLIFSNLNKSAILRTSKPLCRRMEANAVLGGKKMPSSGELPPHIFRPAQQLAMVFVTTARLGAVML